MRSMDRDEVVGEIIAVAGSGMVIRVAMVGSGLGVKCIKRIAV